ncbi:MAG: DUF5615 family PIN-like protein [Deltaproteobacteria bacterium]|nr:DUF5615 family PIN-like protein [Deltaproteobacteria bacterium]
MERSSGLRFLADENIAASAIDSLRGLGIDVVTVDDRRLRGFPDRRLLDAATAEHRVILTQGTDFGTSAGRFRRKRPAPARHQRRPLVLDRPAPALGAVVRRPHLHPALRASRRKRPRCFTTTSLPQGS